MKKRYLLKPIGDLSNPDRFVLNLAKEGEFMYSDVKHATVFTKYEAKTFIKECKDIMFTMITVYTH